MTVTPAYGRDYKSAKDAKADWEAGKDFVYQDISSQWHGKNCSIRDFKRTDKLQLRYKKMTQIVIVNGSK
jgi:hypothetical protein